MNWITKAINFGQKIKKVLKKRPSKKDIENSDWTSCCKGPILKKDLEENLWVCNSCGKHHRISCVQRFDVFFGKNNYEILETPIPSEDPLKWVDTKSYKERLKAARLKTKQNCAVMIAKGKINNIDVTVGSINFEYIGGSVGAAEGEAIIYGVQHAIENNTPYIFFPCGGGQRMFESPIALANMTRTTLAISELKKNILSGKIYGTAIDVFPKEPKNNKQKFSSILIGLPNTILTPHIGGSTKEAQKNIGTFVPNKVIDFINTGATSNSVNFPSLVLPELKNAHRFIPVSYTHLTLPTKA